MQVVADPQTPFAKRVHPPAEVLGDLLPCLNVGAEHGVRAGPFYGGDRSAAVLDQHLARLVACALDAQPGTGPSEVEDGGVEAAD